MKKVLVYGRNIKDQDNTYIRQLFDSLKELSFDVFVLEPYNEQLKNLLPDISYPTINNHAQFKTEDFDLVITMGGDGTILKAMTLIQNLSTPMLGINLGRLGFLANAEKAKIHQALLKIKNGNYDIEERNMIGFKSNGDHFNDCPFALNDFTIHKRDNSSMILIHCFIDGALLNSYWADGIIVSTPTGSTGYSLSCGGPIITPNCGNLVIAPVAPHNLNARPVVINDTSEIKFKVKGRAESFLVTLDSRNDFITTNHEIILTKCDFPSRLIRLDNTSFFKTIHQKLMWGIDKRNV